ncbi:hypothetical protein OAU50_05565 [Planctomycetota bacterium]|nr:hypothetical protein [Planctomycetota bacterium]
MAKRSVETTAKKVAYVAQLLGKDKTLTMNAIGKAVIAKFGTQLAHPKLREAFVKAGGKVDTRKGNRTKGNGRKGKAGAKTAKKAAKKAGKKRGRTISPDTIKKMDYVKSLAKKPGMTMNKANDAVNKKYGVKLAFNRLKDAFKSGGGKVGKPGRRTGSKNKGTRSTTGRRSSDKSATRTRNTLGGLPAHMVVVSSGRNVETAQFGKKSDAQAFARKQLESGVPASAIGYYTRGSLEVSFGI